MSKTSYDPKWLLGLYRRMVLIRQFEDRVKFLFLEGVMPGTIHQYQGQEACGVGVCAALNPDDVITTTHRPHGHCIAKGLDVGSAMAELFGKVTGCCHGKGGSMHMGDLAKGIVPAVAIVGGGLPLTTGMALAFKMRKESRVAVGFMGDGATNEGAFHEALNMAAIWDLPALFVVENNLYGASTHVSKVVKTPHISDRAAAYGMPGLTVDGNDVLVVFEAAREAAARARAGKGRRCWNCSPTASPGIRGATRASTSRKKNGSRHWPTSRSEGSRSTCWRRARPTRRRWTLWRRA